MAGSVYCMLNKDAAWPLAANLLQAPQKNTLYIWCGEVAELLSLYGRCYALLTDAERAKAMRFFRAADQQRYVIQHGLLRRLLGWYLDMPVLREDFLLGEYGKPYLQDMNNQACFFNLSNSGGAFLIAIGDKEMGADLECPAPGFSYQGIAGRCFGESELDFISAAEYPQRAFYLLWTRKEALLKAAGKGIDDNLPDVPALDGNHTLPADYNDTNWLTESFMAASPIISVTYALPQMRIILAQIDAGWVDC